MAIKKIALLGSTGSIGLSTLDVIAGHPHRFQVVSLAAGRNGRLLVEQARRFQPEVVAIRDPVVAEEVRQALAGEAIQVLSGEEGVVAAAAWDSATMTLSAIVGAAGLAPTLAAIRAGKDIALANKECLVMAGSLFMDEIARHDVRLIPVDSEHSAIFQALFNGRTDDITLHDGKGGPEKVGTLILTASGGPFRGWNQERLATVTREQALAHPTWSMGPKISIDSATIMNKGLEIIEAFHLFGLPGSHIQVVVHPESIVHSMVAYPDGSVLAQMGTPDMRTPIAVALAWPERITTGVTPLDLAQLGQLHFYPPPEKSAFPCLELAYRALELGGTAPAVLNAANEVAVAAFLRGNIGFADIPRLNGWTLETVPVVIPGSIEEILAMDQEARRKAGEWVTQHNNKSDHPC